MDTLERQAIQDNIDTLILQRDELTGASNKKARKRINKKISKLNSILPGASPSKPVEVDDDWDCLHEEEGKMRDIETSEQINLKSAHMGVDVSELLSLGLKWDIEKHCYVSIQKNSDRTNSIERKEIAQRNSLLSDESANSYTDDGYNMIQKSVVENINTTSSETDEQIKIVAESYQNLSFDLENMKIPSFVHQKSYSS